MNNGLLEHLQAFVAIAHARSLTGASIATGIGQATLSRQLAALERRLGCSLFRRSTRAISLTERGELLLEHATALLAMTEAAEAAVQEQGAPLRGRLRIACSHGFGRRILLPALPEWQRLHPAVQLELELSDRLTPLIEERVDVAFRLGELAPSNLVARRLARSSRILVATPAYVRRRGPLLEPAQLQDHDCLLCSELERPGLWTFHGPQGRVAVHVSSRLTLSTVDALYEAVLADLGIALMPAWFWHRELREGRVLGLLGGYALPEQAIHAVTAARPSPGGKLARFIAFVEGVLATVARDGAA